MILQPASEIEAADIIRRARAEGRPLIPAGTLSRLGQRLTAAGDRAKILSAGGLKKIVSVEPENLLAVVEAGLTPAEVRAALEPAGLHWPVSGLDGRSLGAIMAEGGISLEQMARGPMTDWILGATFIEPSGRLIASGGRTLKNVSGYDLTRFLWKARGTLGLSTAFILKCLPRPETSLVFEAEFKNGRAAAEAAERIIRERIFPQNLRLVYQGQTWVLAVWLAGFQEDVLARGRAAGLEPASASSAAEAFQRRGLDRWPLAEGPGLIYRLGSRAGLLELAGRLDQFDGLTAADLDIGGGLARLACGAQEAERAGGLASALRPLCGPPAGEIYALLKKGLDPDDLFFPSEYFRTEPKMGGA